MLSAVIICPTSQVVNVLIYNCSAHRNSSAIVPRATWQIIEQVFILTVLTILGAFLGNLLVIVSIIYFTKLRTLTNAFLLSLAVADFLVGIIVMPFSMIKVMFGWYFGKAFCTIHTVMDVMLCTSSIMNLSCIAFDRYYAVWYPLRYRFRVSQKRVTTLLLVCWVLPGLVSFVPLLLGLHLTGLETIHSQLDPHDCVFIVNIPYALCASVISSYLPMLVMLAAYGKIFQVGSKPDRYTPWKMDPTKWTPLDFTTVLPRRRKGKLLKLLVSSLAVSCSAGYPFSLQTLLTLYLDIRCIILFLKFLCGWVMLILPLTLCYMLYLINLSGELLVWYLIARYSPKITKITICQMPSCLIHNLPHFHIKAHWHLKS